MQDKLSVLNKAQPKKICCGSYLPVVLADRYRISNLNACCKQEYFKVRKVESADLSNSFNGPSGKISSTPERPNRTLDAKKGSSVTLNQDKENRNTIQWRWLKRKLNHDNIQYTRKKNLRSYIRALHYSSITTQSS